MKFSRLIVGALASALFACDQAPEEKVTESGMAYVMHQDNLGNTPDSTDIMTFNYTISNSADSIVDNSWTRGMPVEVQVGTATGLGPLQEALFLMSEGDSMTMRTLSDKLYGERLPNGISTGETISIAIKVEKLQTEEAFLADRDAKEKALQQEEDDKLTQYLEANGLVDATTTETGLIYIIEKKGNGDVPSAGDEVKVNYTGMLLDGTVFDTSLPEVAKENDMYNEQREYSPFTFKLGQGMVIAGWDEAIALLPVGTKAKLFIPSSLGYGPRGAGNLIPPYASLVFDVELLSKS